MSRDLQFDDSALVRYNGCCHDRTNLETSDRRRSPGDTASRAETVPRLSGQWLRLAQAAWLILTLTGAALWLWLELVRHG
ncbi:MAG: hypothetical protein KDE29_09795 [Anaerolineales bacterium]|nr:hypothetical protein [Anaerolineales bacterium]